MVSRGRLTAWVCAAALVAASCSGSDSIETSTSELPGIVTDRSTVAAPASSRASTPGPSSTGVLGAVSSAADPATSAATGRPSAPTGTRPGVGTDETTSTEAPSGPVSSESSGTNPGAGTTSMAGPPAAPTSIVGSGAPDDPPPTTIAPKPDSTTTIAARLPAGYAAVDTSSQFSVFLGGSPEGPGPCDSFNPVVGQIGQRNYSRAVVGATVDVCVMIPGVELGEGGVTAGAPTTVTFVNGSGERRPHRGGPSLCQRLAYVPGEPVCFYVGRITPGAGDVGTWTVTVDRVDGLAPVTQNFSVGDQGRPTVIGDLLSGFTPGTRPRLTAVFLGYSIGARADGTIGPSSIPPVPQAFVITSVEGPTIGADGTATWSPPQLRYPEGFVAEGALSTSWSGICFVATLGNDDCTLYFRN